MCQLNFGHIFFRLNEWGTFAWLGQQVCCFLRVYCLHDVELPKLNKIGRRVNCPTRMQGGELSTMNASRIPFLAKDMWEEVLLHIPCTEIASNFILACKDFYSPGRCFLSDLLMIQISTGSDDHVTEYLEVNQSIIHDLYWKVFACRATSVLWIRYPGLSLGKMSDLAPQKRKRVCWQYQLIISSFNERKSTLHIVFHWRPCPSLKPALTWRRFIWHWKL